MRAALLVLALLSGPAEGACRMALALGLDISGSVDAAEYRLQLDGLAAALESAPVRAALLAMPDAPVELAVFEWSGPQDRRLTVPWTRVVDSAEIDGVVARLRRAERPRASPSTALGSAMAAGRSLLDTRACWRRVLDLSGDGPSNTGPRPRLMRRDMHGIEINGLVVAEADIARAGRLADYYEAEVIHGADAFVETARGYSDYTAAMTRKLLRELRSMVLGAVTSPARAGSAVTGRELR